MEEHESTKYKYKQLVRILDAKYESVNLGELVAKTETLNAAQRKELLVLLRKYEDLCLW